MLKRSHKFKILCEIMRTLPCRFGFWLQTISWYGESLSGQQTLRNTRLFRTDATSDI